MYHIMIIYYSFKFGNISFCPNYKFNPNPNPNPNPIPNPNPNP